MDSFCLCLIRFICVFFDIFSSFCLCSTTLTHFLKLEYIRIRFRRKAEKIDWIVHWVLFFTYFRNDFYRSSKFIFVESNVDHLILIFDFDFECKYHCCFFLILTLFFTFCYSFLLENNELIYMQFYLTCFVILLFLYYARNDMK